MACRAVIDLARKTDPASASSNITTSSSSTNKNTASSSSAQQLNSNAEGHSQSDTDALPETRKLKQGIVSLSTNLESQTQDEADNNAYLWGKDTGVAAFINIAKDAHTTAHSAKDKRKQKQELERVRREYKARVDAMEREEEKQGGNSVVSKMVLPDYDSGRNEKDVRVSNVGLALENGRMLLDGADVKFSHQRRYGLVGKNGIGKTTLLKAIARMEIEGFPRHHRVLHVRQEVKSAGGDITVLQAVLEADAERNALLTEEKELLATLEEGDDTDTDTDTDKDNETNEQEVEAKEDDSTPSTALNGVSDTPKTTAASSLLQKRQQLQLRLKTTDATTDTTTTNTTNTDSDTQQQGTAQFQANIEKLDQVYARLNILSSDSAESRAAQILSGLQFTPEMQRGPTSALSGGWRMRVSLAAALFIEPDFLLLDEPTNHLDLEAVLWLESYLCDYKHTLVVVSHDRGFLNEICTDIIEFKKLKLNYYKGNYDTYIKTSNEQVRNQMRVYQAYQDKRAHLMDFIEKFRANAKRATLVQSRVKAVERMDLVAPDEVEVEPIWRFNIPNPEPLGRPIISVDDASFDYNAKEKKRSEYLLQGVNFGIDLESRIGILGPNGAGKSTLLNMITDKIAPMQGSISRNGRLRIGIFTQHSSDKFDLQLSSVENMMATFPHAMDQEMRSFLGKFQIQGSEALKPMMMLSGGQKSRVAFAALAYQKPHVIIMDEPTNHLDMESIDALVEAIQDFKGGLVVVSHDQYFITNTCGELWVIGEGKATRFRGTFDKYKEHTLERTAKRVAQSVKSLCNING